VRICVCVCVCLYVRPATFQPCFRRYLFDRKRALRFVWRSANNEGFCNNKSGESGLCLWRREYTVGATPPRYGLWQVMFCEMILSTIGSHVGLGCLGGICRHYCTCCILDAEVDAAFLIAAIPTQKCVANNAKDIVCEYPRIR
jgi:hypothetical protein